LSQKVSRETLLKVPEIKGQMPSSTELVIKKLEKTYFQHFSNKESALLSEGYRGRKIRIDKTAMNES